MALYKLVVLLISSSLWRLADARRQTVQETFQQQQQYTPRPPHPPPHYVDSSASNRHVNEIDRKLYGRFLHLTDLHPDPHYTYGSLVETGCHRIAHRKDEADGKQTAGWWGTGVSGCDSPPHLIASSLKWMASHFLPLSPVSPNLTSDYAAFTATEDDTAGLGLDFIIWTGDSARHDIDSHVPRTMDEILELNRWTLQQVELAFPGVPIVPSIGNNDVFPHNIMFPGPNSVTKQLVEIWSHHIPEYELHTFAQGGYFVKELIPNRLAAMSLNTLYFFNSNKAVDGCVASKNRNGDGPNDPGTAQLDWLQVQLDLFRQRKMQVHLLGHVPPTPVNYFSRCYKRYTDIVLRFQDTIVGQHFGHMNTDAFLIQHDGAESCLLDDQDQDQEEQDVYIRSVAEWLPKTLYQDYKSIPDKAHANEDFYSVFFIAPSIIPTYYPSVRVWTYNVSDADRYEPKDLDPMSLDQDRQGQISMIGDYQEEDNSERTYNLEPFQNYRHHRPTLPDFKKNKKRLPRHASPFSPSRQNTYLSLLGYSQWVMDIDDQNQQIEKLLKQGEKGTKQAEKVQVEFRLEYTTYQPGILWRQFIDTNGSFDIETPLPVPFHLLQRELDRLQVDPPRIVSKSSRHVTDIDKSLHYDHGYDIFNVELIDSIKDNTMKTIKMSKKIRKFTDYSLPHITIGEMLNLARRLATDKKLWKRFVERIFAESGVKSRTQSTDEHS